MRRGVVSVSLDSQTTTSPLEKIEQILSHKVESGALELPLLPQVASEVMALTSDPEADAAKLSALIHKDQALAAHVLRIANSPAYMPRSPVVSLQHAVAMLGINLLSEIAFTASLKAGALQVPGHEEHVRALWQHSLASGAFAKEVARTRRVNVESAYLCGLLHEIGKPVVLRAVTTIAQEQNIPLDRPTLDIMIEGHHSRIGGLIGEKWGLPRQVIEAAQYYADYDHAPSFRQECILTCIADRLATHLLCPDDMPEEVLRDHPAFAELNLYTGDVEQLVKGKDKVLAVVQSMNL
ncbi:HDOD domain-containing protein [Candidatus Nitrospira inopinata]|jgi:putative nucleotidyltransferase with HDIG domain|uniref:HDOD domain-containing protein n=1 Tax=Candidatus Nitrospira inopinata TaxID=1715989 RepID=UPI0007810E8A|nr:HDOD domain-containing protein [Candidatus Nitrospira inopinata]